MSPKSEREAVPLLLLGILVATTMASAAFAADPSCFECHDDQATEFAESAHAQAGLSCIDCHGGDPKAADEEAHATDDFRRAETKQEIAEACAACHSDVRRMNAYGLPTDQLARYRTSRHGEQLFGKNDQKVAGCTDCHGVHEILKPDAPQSRVHPANIPATCGTCHADADLMGEYKLPSDVLTEYRKSHHATMLFDQDDLSAPTCVTCHGNHGATPPGTVEVGQVCGKCHGRQRELFEKSPHAELAADGGFSECVACHGNHAILKASVRLFQTACVECHDEGETAWDRRTALATLIEEHAQAYKSTEQLVRDATVRGLATEDEQLLLQEINTAVTQLEALQHTLDFGELEPVAARAAELTTAIEANVARLERIEQWKRLALIPIFSFLAIMAVLFSVKRIMLDNERSKR